MSMLFMDIDEAQLDRVLKLFSEVNEKTVKLAYNRALRRTEGTVRQLSAKLMRDRLGLKPGNQKLLRKRIQAYLKPGDSAAEMKFWFGLNDLDPMLFRGGMRKTAGGLLIRGEYYERAFVAVIYGRKGVWQRKGAARFPIERLRVPISDEMTVALEDEVFEQIPDIFLRHFETDLRGRVRSSEWKTGWSDRRLSAAAGNIAGW